MTRNSNVTVPVTGALPGSDEDPDDSSYGLAMFLMFTTSVLSITFAVCVLAMVGSWWMLGVVYGTDLIVTGLVFKVVFGAFASPAYPDLERVESASKAVLARRVVDLEAHRTTLAAHH